MNDSTYSNVSEPNITEYPAYTAYRLINKVVPPFLLVLGTVGNITSIAVLTRQSFRSSSTYLYLIGLALSDLMVLYTGLLPDWIEENRFGPNTISPFTCKVKMWMILTSADVSSWILTVVTIQRVIAVCQPHRVRSLCTRTLACTLMAALVLVSLAMNSHTIYGIDVVDVPDMETNGTTKNCWMIDDAYYRFFYLRRPWVDMVKFSLIPCSIMIVGNVIIWVKVTQSRRRTRGELGASRRSLSRQRSQRSQIGMNSSMAVMLFTLNVVFLVCTLPIAIFSIGVIHWASDPTNKQRAGLKMWGVIVHMLMSTNSAINFILYCVSGKKFRQELKEMIYRPILDTCRRWSQPRQLVTSPHSQLKLREKKSAESPKHTDTNDLSASQKESCEL